MNAPEHREQFLKTPTYLKLLYATAPRPPIFSTVDPFWVIWCEKMDVIVDLEGLRKSCTGTAR